MIDALLAWIPLVNPLKLPPSTRLLTFFPLAFCVALVYRATRARTARDLTRGTLLTFVNICVGMIAIAAGFFLLNEFIRRAA